jgi:protocatechuate 3,4-dioxygenase beta subunit
LEKTIWGWIRGHNPTEGGIVSKLGGRVILPDESVLAGALVEVFDNPDLDVNKRKRLAACRTGETGVFRFKRIPPGRYEIRASYSSGLDAGQTMVTLAPKDKNASKNDIVVRMEISN